MGPELRHWRYFVTVADELNFTRAAEKLIVAQQALSAAIRQLEAELGVRLFERTTRQVSLTPAGAALLPRARRLLAFATELADDARAGGPEPPVLRVDIVSSGLETGTEVLRRLRANRDDLSIEQVEGGIPAGLQALRSGSLDVLFGNAVNAPAGIAAELIRLEPFQVMLPADHPSAVSNEIPVRALSGETWLLPGAEVSPEWVTQVVDMCQQAGFRPRRYPGATHGSAAAAELVVEAGIVVPTMAWTSVPDGTVVRPLVEPATLYPWSIMWLDERITGAIDDVRSAATQCSDEFGWLAAAKH